MLDIFYLKLDKRTHAQYMPCDRNIINTSVSIVYRCLIFIYNISIYYCMVKNLITILFILFSISLIGQSAGYVTDFIRYLSEDGISYKDYIKVDSKRASTWHYLPKGRNPEEVFSFTSPREYEFRALLDERYNQILFNQGSFSLIRDDKMNDQDLIINDSRFIFQNDYKSSKEGYYGFCAAVPEGFQEVNYVWVFPERFEVLSYEANADGEWSLIENTLSYTAKDVNNILFKIEYKPKEVQPLELKDRTVSLKDSMVVSQKLITIDIWDDSKVDNDIISLKVNDEWLVQYLEAKQEKTTFKYVLRQPENYIILRADNVGEIPPNTTAIKINDGKSSHMVVLDSDLGKSEAIKITLAQD